MAVSREVDLAREGASLICRLLASKDVKVVVCGVTAGVALDTDRRAEDEEIPAGQCSPLPAPQ